MTGKQIVSMDIMNVKNPMQIDLIDIQEIEIEEVLATKIIRDEKVGKLQFKESKNLCKIKGEKEPKTVIESLILKNDEIKRKHHAMFV